MIVIVDGQVIEVKNEVKVIVEVGDESESELHLTLTWEGLIMDSVPKANEIEYTRSETYLEMYDDLTTEYTTGYHIDCLGNVFYIPEKDDNR